MEWAAAGLSRKRTKSWNIFNFLTSCRAQELCESQGGRPGLPVPNTPCGLCGRKAVLNLTEQSLAGWLKQAACTCLIFQQDGDGGSDTFTPSQPLSPVVPHPRDNMIFFSSTSPLTVTVFTVDRDSPHRRPLLSSPLTVTFFTVDRYSLHR